MSVAFLSAVEQLSMLRRGEISALELADEHIRRIERLNPVLNALVDFDPERIRMQARRPGPGILSGLPVTIKSCIEVAGNRCEIGSLLRQGAVATQNAVVVERLRGQGAILLGTTNCPEFLMAYETDNRLHGRSNNPWDLARTAGGSSGGESAAIAACLSAGGIGSDSGGSVREPAHFTGICALKPTPGRVSAIGHQPPCAGPFSSLGAVGPMARTMADVELLFNAIDGHEAGDPSSAPIQSRTIHLDDLKQIPVGWLEDDGFVPVTRETREAVHAAVAVLRQQGFKVKAFRPHGLEEARRLWKIFFVQCGAMLYAKTIKGQREQLSPTFLDFLDTAEAEPPLTAPQLLQAWVDADGLRQQVLVQMKEFPLLLTPVCSIPAFRHGERSWVIDGQETGYLDAMRFTQWFNLLACPAAVIPAGRSDEGLPIGVQIAGRPNEDELVVGAARVIDAAFGYRLPPLAGG